MPFLQTIMHYNNTQIPIRGINYTGGQSEFSFKTELTIRESFSNHTQVEVQDGKSVYPDRPRQKVPMSRLSCVHQTIYALTRFLVVYVSL